MRSCCRVARVYGLDAAGGASAVLCQRGQGRTFGGLAIPVAVQAILFDLINGGEKDWMREPVKHKPPYWDLGRDAALVAAHDFALGTAGAGVGATTAGLKGGLGSTSAKTSQGFTVGALVAVNAVGSATIGTGPHFWAGAYEQGKEFGGLGWPAKLPEDALKIRFKGQPLPVTATTIALVATDAKLTKAECKRLAIMANDGLSKCAAAGACAQRRRHGLCRRDRPGGTGRRAAGPDGAGHGGGRLPRARRGARRLRGDGAAFPDCGARLEDALRRRPAMMSYLVVFVGAGVGGVAPPRHEHLGGAAARHALPVPHARHQHRGLAGDGPGRRLVRRARRRRPATCGCSSPPASWAASPPSRPSRSTPCCCGSGTSICWPRSMSAARWWARSRAWCCGLWIMRTALA